MKEERVIKSLKITSIAFGLILGLLSIFLVLNESFALFTSKTDKVTYSFKMHKNSMLAGGAHFSSVLRYAGFSNLIANVVFERNVDFGSIDRTIYFFDASAKQDGSIIGYLTRTQDNLSMYDLHIATSEEEIFANADSSYLFGNFNGTVIFSNLKSIINFGILNTSKTTTMSSMFEGCSSLTSIDLSSFDTRNLINMSSMIEGCSSLTIIDLSSFDTRNVINMVLVFSGCSSLTSLDLSGFNTSNVSSIAGMFSKCSSLTSLDLSSFNTSNVTSMSNMFSGCSSLTSLDLSSFDMGNVTSTYIMFKDCSSLSVIYARTNDDADKLEIVMAFQVALL